MFRIGQSKSLFGAVLLVGGISLSPFYMAMAAGGGGGGGGSAPSASAPRYDPAEEYRSGINALNADNYKAAIKHFRRVTKSARKNAQGHYFLGVSYLRSGDAKKARKPLESAVKYGDDMIVAKRDLALVYLKLGRSTDAQALLQDLTKRDKACAQSCSDKGAITQAIAAIETAMKGGAQASYGVDVKALADASTADQFYYEAVSAINRGEYETGLHHLKTAALAFGPHPDILTYQGFANRKLARFETAEGYYNRALAIAPNHLGALEYYGELKVERGDLSGARWHLAKLDAICTFGCFEAEELRGWIQNAGA